MSSCATSTLRTIPGDISGVHPLIDTWNGVHIFQNFDYSIPNPIAVAKNFDSVWGSWTVHVKAWRAGNPNIFINYYIPFNRDWGGFLDNHVSHSLAYWKAFHPDWILYKCDRVTPAYEYGDPNIPLDFANPALVSWQIQTYAEPASAGGYDGIAADNVHLQNAFGACGVYRNGHWVQRYTGQPNDLQWSADTINWLKQMQHALHHLKHPLALIPNFSLGDLSLRDPQVLQLMSYVDGVLDESGFTDYGNGYLTGSAWVQRIEFIKSMQEQHKPYYIINQFPTVGPAEIQWALASYLMGKEHLSSLFISTIQGYGAEHRHNEYNAQIGSPSGSMYQEQHVYWRDYNYGLSIVNPSATNTYTVTLNAGSHYFDLYGNLVGRVVTMPPHSGLVLLVQS